MESEVEVGQVCAHGDDLVVFRSINDSEFPAVYGWFSYIVDGFEDCDYLNCFIDDLEPLPSDFWAHGWGI